MAKDKRKPLRKSSFLVTLCHVHAGVFIGLPFSTRSGKEVYLHGESGGKCMCKLALWERFLAKPANISIVTP